MAFEKQTDSASLTANAYVDATFFKTYHDDRGNNRSGFSTGDINKAIVKATDYLDTRFNFIGEKSNPSQRTQWPRLSAEDRWGRLRSGVPFEVQEACADYALIALSQSLNPTPTRDDTGRAVQSIREKVGSIDTTIEYTPGASFEMPKYPVADNRLRSSGLVVRGGQIRRA